MPTVTSFLCTWAAFLAAVPRLYPAGRAGKVFVACAKYVILPIQRSLHHGYDGEDKYVKKVVLSMQWLVVIHVLAAILGLGPAYAFPFLLRKASSIQEMERNLSQVAYLEMFPKVFGTLAVLSGLALFFIGSYGSFGQIWIMGTLIVYALIEVLIIGFLNPEAKKLQSALSSQEKQERVASLEPMYARVRNLHAWAGVLGLLIFILMIVKPH